MGEAAKGFVKSLMDFSFTEFITTKLIKVLYMLAILLAALTSVGMIITGFVNKGATSGIISLIIAPVVFVVMVLASRVWLELIIVVFRIAEHTSAIAKSGEEEDAPLPVSVEEPKTRKTTGKKTRKETKKKTKKKTTKGEE